MPVRRAKAKPVKNFGLLRLDYEALVRGAVEGDETCDLPGLGPVPVRIARALLGDAILKLVITKGVDVMNVTHLGRSATVAQQVALWWQSPVCRVEGCGHTFRLENDHRNDWAHTHQTRLDGLDPLCEHHHDLKTRHGWALVDGTGTRPMVPPARPPPPQLPRTTRRTMKPSKPSRRRPGTRGRTGPGQVTLMIRVPFAGPCGSTRIVQCPGDVEHARAERRGWRCTSTWSTARVPFGRTKETTSPGQPGEGRAP